MKKNLLSYSTNVHPAESLDDLSRSLRDFVAPIMHRSLENDGTSKAFAPTNLRIGMRQADEILQHPALPSNSALSDEILKAPPSPACEGFLRTLDETKLDVVGEADGEVLLFDLG